MPAITPALALNAQGDQVKTIQANLAKVGATVPPAETAAGTYGAGTVDAVKQFQIAYKLPATGTVDAATQSMLTAAAATSGTNQSTVSGRLTMDYGVAANGLTARLYNIGYGGTATKLAESKTDATGVYSLAYTPSASGANVEVRAVDAQGQETTISAIVYNASAQEALNLVVPAIVQPLTAEFTRLSADVQGVVGGTGLQNLATAQENSTRQDLTLVSQSTGWDARLLSLAATAAQQATPTGMGSDTLYALYRAGLPTDPNQLALTPSAAITLALQKATAGGIVSFTDAQIAAAATAFQAYATKTLLTLTAPGGVSNFGLLFNASGITDATQRPAFENLVFSQPMPAADFWTQASKLGIPAATLSALRTQGQCFYLTLNNLQLTQKILQVIGPSGDLSQLAEQDYHEAATWQTALTTLAGTGGTAAQNALIPPAYLSGASNPLEAYAADLARKVRVSFPTQTAARLAETNALALGTSGTPVATFLKAAAGAGYQLGRTPLNAFLKRASSASPPLPALSETDTEQLKRLHRLYQITPSNESLQVALAHGFTSANDIASYTRTEFIAKHGADFPSFSEADLVYRKSQQVSSVTFNFFAMAKQLDTNPPVYGLSSPPAVVQAAKNSIIEQFPSMQTLFGSMDFCQCDDCRSVLSPAAYFVDLLEFLRNSTPNAAAYTPLDALIGSVDGKVKGRRPDLAALPLSCENTNTAMPYIDIVNEILEYYVCHSDLDTGLAYDTGTATTDDLTAEPQNLLPAAYSALVKPGSNIGYPLGLPFDLWLETVRGFYGYLKTPLSQALETFRPVDALELFAPSVPANPPIYYYRYSIFAEALGLSPSECELFTNPNPLQTWFELYSYPTEVIALNGGTYPATPPNFTYQPLPSAQYLAQYLGLTYQQVTDLVTTGFLNPKLGAISFQLERFGLDLDQAFSYAGQQAPGNLQPGYPALSAGDTATFEATLNAITQQYKAQNPSSTFNAKAWLLAALPAGYSKSVLVLHDPDGGCNFAATTLAYADGSAASPLDFLKFNLFTRLWQKLGWTMDETDRALQLFFAAGGGLPATTDPSFGAAFSSAWQTALVSLAHLNALAAQWNPALGRVALLPLWGPIPTTGNNPLYAQIFLSAAVLNCDPAFDDPVGQFPSSTSDPLSNHQAGIQGGLGLSASDMAAILADAGTAATMVTYQGALVPSFTLTNLSLLYRYNLMATSLNLSVEDFIALKGMSVDLTSFSVGQKPTGLNPFPQPTGAPFKLLKDDLLFTQTLQLAQQANMVAGSGFTVEDLNYLLLHQFDPVGKYQVDENALMTLVQSVGAGLQQIQISNAVPADAASLSDDLIQQRLSSLFTADLLSGVVGLLTNATGFTASQSGVAPASQIDPTQFPNDPELSFSYDSTLQSQTLTYTGALLNWKASQLAQLNPAAASAAVLTALLSQAEAQVKPAFDAMVGNLLGVWASLVQYEATRAVANPITFATPLPDPALEVGYDAVNKVQWASYRGVLTSAKMSALTAANASPDFAALLTNLQSQSLPAFNELLGSMLGLWANGQTYQATQATVAPTSQLDPSLLAAFPQIQVSYDSAAQVQTLTCQGVLTTTLQTAVTAAIPAANPAAAVLTSLLTTVRSQALAFFQAQAANWTSAPLAGADLDNDSQPYSGLDAAKMQKAAKAELVGVFSPLLAQKLSRQFVIQTLSDSLSSDLALTDSLVTDAALLENPSQPGLSLMGAFLAVGQTGVSATYYASADQSGPALGSGAVVAASAATTDPSNPSPSTVESAHFEGYLQVSTDGPYRFFAELANVGANVMFVVDAPASLSSMANPVLSYAAAKAGDETSQFVDLQGGVAYHFTLDFTSLGAGGAASLLVQGEVLLKGPLSQLLLYPETAVDGFNKGNILLSKALQLIQGTGLDVVEATYLTENAPEFNGFSLSSLPTHADDSPAAASNAQALFAQFLALADYADLRKGPAGGTNGLIGVFENVGQKFTEPVNSGASNLNQSAPWTILGNLTRRDPQVVRDVGVYFGLLQQITAGATTQLTAVGDFGNNKGIRRIWQGLQIIQTLGLPVQAVTDSSQIVSSTPAIAPNVIAGNLRNAVKAQYDIDTWRPVAKSVFDPLRQKKRDALVAYIVSDLMLENEEQLFEYFLVDPGMEPVVQTSRLRLALSSVQTFVQRCLLNLENGNTQNPMVNVNPSAIDAAWWQWMKRYRVWEANREIFLYPENWMEPELRLDKTDLFQTLQSALLQGDVTSDLVEDAFYKYLQGLEARARLDIVATYLDQSGPEDATDQLYPDYTLHVIGRTHGHPHQYFYRTYADGVWTAWSRVTTAIDGDHLAVVVWRNRVNLFWVSFQPLSQPPTLPGPQPGAQTVSSMDFGTLASNLQSAAAQQQIQVQLNWSEYFQGKWSDCISSDVNKYDPVIMPPVIMPGSPAFDPSQVYIHVTKEGPDAYGNDGPVLIHLDFPNAQVRVQMRRGIWVDVFRAATFSFRVTSKNCNPDFGTKYAQADPENPYPTAQTYDATQYTGAASLQVQFMSNIAANGTGTPTSETILQSVNDYALLLCSNPVAPAFLSPTEPLYQEAGALVAPFFFKDINVASSTYSTANELTFFVEPNLTEQTITDWYGWAIGIPLGNPAAADPGWWQNVPVQAQIPASQIVPANPGDPAPNLSVYHYNPPIDWLTAPSTTVSYQSTLIRQTGGIVAANATIGATGLSPSLAAKVDIVSSQGLNTAILGSILARPTNAATGSPASFSALKNIVS